MVLVVEGILVARHFFSPLHSTPDRKEEGKEKVALRSESQQISTPFWSAGGSCPLEVGPGVPPLYPTHPLIIKLIKLIPVAEGWKITLINDEWYQIFFSLKNSSNLFWKFRNSETKHFVLKEVKFLWQGGEESIYFKYNLILPEPRGHISKPIKKHCLVNCKMKLYTLNSSEDLELCWLFSVDVLRLTLRVIEPATSTLNAWINQSIN